MWRCANCGAFVPHGTICLECGQPLDPAVAAIDRKIRYLRFLSNGSWQWTQRGAVIGLVAAIILAPMLAALLVPRFIASTDGTLATTDSFVQFLTIFLSLPIFMPLLFGCIAFVLAAVVRPICTALFFRAERFEQECDSAKQ